MCWIWAWISEARSASAAAAAKSTADTTVTGRSVNAPVRILKNQMSREYLKQERAGASREELEKYTLGSLRRAVFDGDTKTGSLMCGQVAGMLHEVRPLRTILEELCGRCEETVRQLAREVEA